MKYVDRRLKQIDQAAWARLYREPDYERVKDLNTKFYGIRASWVGVHLPEHESRCRPFLLEAWNWGKDDKGDAAQADYAAWWYEDERTLLIAFEATKGVGETTGKLPGRRKVEK